MRFWIIATTIAVAALVTLVAWREVRLSRMIEALHQDREQWIGDRQSLNERLNLAEEKLALTEIPAFPETGKVPPVQRIAALEVQLIAALERQIRSLQLALDHQSFGLAIPEYDPTRP